MTSEYSIELQAENINNIKTKQYFQEVLSSYINGNYRSAIVVLWTVTVCDLIYKLQDLSTIYNDTVADGILQTIKEKQDANKKSPEWETKLIELINTQTSMFATYEITHLEDLHKHRHLSAHPVLQEDLDLYQPNKETTRALIRNILESILTKPSMASNKIFQDLIQDLQEKNELFPKIEDLESYITAKYYTHIPSKVKEYVFKQLWKFSLKLNNDDSKKNRTINIRALAILYKQNSKLILKFMDSEKDYFSSNINLDDDMDMKYFVLLCSKYPKIYAKLDTSYKPPIVERIKHKLELWSQAFFIYPNAKDYLNALESEITLSEISKDKNLSKTVIKFCRDNDVINDLIKLYIDRYSSSSSFNDADRCFEALISPVLKLLKQSQFVALLAGIETNNQVYNRGSAYHDHKKIKKKCDKKCTDFDYTQYPKFLKSIED